MAILSLPGDGAGHEKFVGEIALWEACYFIWPSSRAAPLSLADNRFSASRPPAA
jgi:hypothetical protein